MVSGEQIHDEQIHDEQIQQWAEAEAGYDVED